MNSSDITVTNGRLYRPLNKLVNHIVDNRKIKEKVTDAIDSAKIRTGKITKFYPYLDKAEVKLDNIPTPVICKIAHRFTGSLIDFFTPEGDLNFCDNLKEPCIIPRSDTHVLVADISNKDSKERVILAYYNNDDCIYHKPAEEGYFKLTNIGATNNWGIQIGNGTLKISTMDGVTFQEGELHSENETIAYSNTNDVYTKKEVDDIVTKAINDLKQELTENEGG